MTELLFDEIGYWSEIKHDTLVRIARRRRLVQRLRVRYLSFRRRLSSTLGDRSLVVTLLGLEGRTPR